MRFVALVFVSLIALGGCGAGSLTNPVVAHTGMAETRDGYEAALVTVESQGYVIAVKDREHGYLRVLARPGRPETGQPQGTYFDIQAMPGRVEIHVDQPVGRTLTEDEARQLRQRMEALAWEIGGRGQTLGGEMSGPPDWPSMVAPCMPWPAYC